MATKSENKKEKIKKELTKIWEKQIKGKDTCPLWSRSPKSFINWSLSGNKYKEGYKLVVKNKKHKDIMHPYNVKFEKIIRRVSKKEEE